MLQIYQVRTDIDHKLRTDLARLLCPAEIQQIARLRQPQDQNNYIVSHAVLRSLLARLCSVPPQQLGFTTGPWGKPQLISPNGYNLQFNISHSGYIALIAIAKHPIGIDIESIKPVDYKTLAQQFFTADELLRINDNSTFFKIWTAKEAVVKVSGRGLNISLQAFEVPRSSHHFQAIHTVHSNPDLKDLHVAQLPIELGYQAAISLTNHSCIGTPPPIHKLCPLELRQVTVRQFNLFME